MSTIHRIKLFENARATTVLNDLLSDISKAGNEQGIVGLITFTGPLFSPSSFSLEFLLGLCKGVSDEERRTCHTWLVGCCTLEQGDQLENTRDRGPPGTCLLNDLSCRTICNGGWDILSSNGQLRRILCRGGALCKQKRDDPFGGSYCR